MARTLAKGAHDEAFVERALLLLAQNGGTITRTRTQLEQQGLHPPSHATLKDWRDERHRGRYLQHLHDSREQIATLIATEAEEVAIQAAAEERAMLSAITQARENGELEPKDYANILRNVTTTKSLNIDKIASPLRGRPTTVIEHTNPDEILRKLERLAPGLVVDGTAEELEAGQQWRASRR